MGSGAFCPLSVCRRAAPAPATAALDPAPSFPPDPPPVPGSFLVPWNPTRSPSPWTCFPDPAPSLSPGSGPRSLRSRTRVPDLGRTPGPRVPGCGPVLRSPQASSPCPGPDPVSASPPRCPLLSFVPLTSVLGPLCSPQFASIPFWPLFLSCFLTLYPLHTVVSPFPLPHLSSASSIPLPFLYPLLYPLFPSLPLSPSASFHPFSLPISLHPLSPLLCSPDPFFALHSTLSPGLQYLRPQGLPHRYGEGLQA